VVSLDQLLDGLDVAVDPFVLHSVRDGCPIDGSAPAPLSRGQDGAGLFTLADGVTISVSSTSVAVHPPGPHTRIVRRAAGHDTMLACSRIRVTYRGAVDFFDRLREPLVEPFSSGDPLYGPFAELLEEVTAHRPGSRAMVEALLRRCLILLFRRCWAQGQCRLAWLAALEDVRLGRAVAEMQERPEQPLTLPRLAEVAGMSRSVFAARFTDAVGQSPIEFLKTLRLERAAHLLAHTDMPVKSVAARAGYASRSSFTRAFLARHGLGPARFRAAMTKDSGP